MEEHERKAQTLHMIGNAHLDPVWLWQWQEGFQEVKATFRAVLDLMREYDDFLFTSSSAYMYEWVEQNDPAMFEEIKRRVAEGRWEIAGGWWIQPDCNIPSGESPVRQALYGQRYFKAALGVTATVGYNVDSFGHNAMLPQILSKSGLRYYVFMRPQPHEQGLPARLFWWESDDGSRVLAFRIPFEYQTPRHGVEAHVRRCIPELKAPFDDMMCFYGVGNHGGGPTRENIDTIHALDRDPRFPALRFSTPNRFFAAVEEKDLRIPVVHDELQHHASGCYAVHAGVKRWNRRAENLLLTAEAFSTLAQRITALPYPSDFDRAWKDVLFNQFHDILAGTSIEPAYEDARDLYGEATAIAARHLNSAIQSLSWNIAIPRDERTRPVVVFNPHAWPVAANVELEYGRLPEGAVLVDDEDAEVPLQRVRSLATVSGGRTRLSFIAHLPPLGYRVYRLVAPDTTDVPAPLTITSPAPQSPTDTTGGSASNGDDYVLENDLFRLSIDPASGGIGSLYDKRDGFEVFKGPGAVPVVISDRSDTWGHNVLRFDQVAGTFTPVSIKQLAAGPVQSAIRVQSTYGRSVLWQDFVLYPDLEYIDVRVTVDWREHFALLKLRFPLNLSTSMKATYEIPYGHLHRPTNGEEEPGQRWFDLTGVARGTGNLYGLSVLNDSTYSFDITHHVMSLTLLRSPIYAHHVPYEPRQEEDYVFIDQGVHHVTYRLLPHQSSWEQAGTVRRAAELNVPPIALVETYHDGPLPQCASYIDVDRDNVVVSVLKRAEDDDGVIVRCYETARIATTATIRLPLWERTITADFAPCEIKTFHIPDDPARPIRETNLLEEGE